MLRNFISLTTPRYSQPNRVLLPSTPHHRQITTQRANWKFYNPRFQSFASFVEMQEALRGTLMRNSPEIKAMLHHRQARRPDLIMKMVEEHRTSPKVPDGPFYSMAFSQLGRCGAMKEMEEIFQEYVAKGKDPSPLDLKELLICYGMQRQFDKAEEVATIMKQTYPRNPWVYEKILVVFSWERHSERLAKLFDEIHKLKVVISPDAANIMLKCLAERGQFDEMMKLCENMEKFRGRFGYTSHHTALLALYGNLNESAKVEELFEKMRRRNLIPDVTFYKEISQAVALGIQQTSRSKVSINSSLPIEEARMDEEPIEEGRMDEEPIEEGQADEEPIEEGQADEAETK